jgi:hypothetical protein
LCSSRRLFGRSRHRSLRMCCSIVQSAGPQQVRFGAAKAGPSPPIWKRFRALYDTPSHLLLDGRKARYREVEIVETRLSQSQRPGCGPVNRTGSPVDRLRQRSKLRKRQQGSGRASGLKSSRGPRAQYTTVRPAMITVLVSSEDLVLLRGSGSPVGLSLPKPFQCGKPSENGGIPASQVSIRLWRRGVPRQVASPDDDLLRHPYPYQVFPRLNASQRVNHISVFRTYLNHLTKTVKWNCILWCMATRHR